MADTPTIADDKVVSIHYSLTLENGQVASSSKGGEPMAYLHGHQNIVPGLETALEGGKVGDKFKVQVAPKDGYGEARPEAVQQVPREAFPDDMELAAGMSFVTKDETGEVTPVWVVSVADDAITITLDHPLAGETLNFAVEVIEIRDAAEEELQHGHPHGPGGHDH